MKDVKVVRRRNILPVLKVTKISSSPPILEVIGKSFVDATQVRLNDAIVTDWVLASSDRILVYIPSFLQKITIDTIVVLTEVLQSGDNFISFEIGYIEKVEGMDSLLQHFIKLLLQAPGTNVFNPIGGGILKLAGKNSVNFGTSIKADLIEAVDRTKNFILKDQANRKIPLSEKMANAEIVGLGFGPDHTELILSILITNTLGQSISANITP